MKTLKFLAIAAATAAVLASCQSDPKVDVAKPTASEIDSVSYLIGVNFGYFLKANNFAEKLSDINMATVKKGMNDFINAKGAMNSEEFNASFKISPDDMNQVFEAYITKRNEYSAAVNKAKGEAFLEEMNKKDNVIKTESGLLYEILEDGNDVKPVSDADTVWCHYKGTLIDGTQFDGTEEGSDSVQFVLDRVIKGWTEGLKLIGEGGKIKLYVPSELAYGERPAGMLIKPNSTLVFEISLEKVAKAAVEEPAAEEK